LFTTILTTFFFSAYILSKTYNKITALFFAFNISIAIYIFGYLLELNSDTLNQKIFWNHVQYFGISFFVPLWLMFVLSYVRKNKIFNNYAAYFGFFFIPAITLFMNLTNSYHKLYYHSMQLNELLGFANMQLIKGPWYMVQTVYSTFIILSATGMILWKYKKSREERVYYRLLLIASFIPYFGLLLIFLDGGRSGLDFTALFIPPALILLIFAILKYDFLEIKSMAREKMFEISSEAVFILDNEFRLVDFNRAAKGFLDTHQEKLLNRLIDTIIENRPGLLNCMKQEEKVIWSKVEEGQELFFEITSIKIQNAYNRNIGILKTIRDITEEIKLQKKMEFLADIDALSGLNNRRHFMELGQKELMRAKRYNQPFSILMMDIDHFKATNDTYGHAAGDKVIENIGLLMRDNFRITDILGRIGGEEFAVILANTSLEEGAKKAESFRKNIASNVMKYNQMDISVTISLGVAAFDNNAKNLEEILKIADEALYTSKKEGRNRVTVRAL
jgi:diguanylate cyclase (GGDEF)-like protein/PAS domain S-box-containing protein